MAEITLTRPYLAPGLFPFLSIFTSSIPSPYSLYHSPHYSPSSTLQLLTNLHLCNSSFLSYRPISLSGRVRPCIPLSHGCPSALHHFLLPTQPTFGLATGLPSDTATGDFDIPPFLPTSMYLAQTLDQSASSGQGLDLNCGLLVISL
jgi:hypothetical protein